MSPEIKLYPSQSQTITWLTIGKDSVAKDIRCGQKYVIADERVRYSIYRILKKRLNKGKTEVGFVYILVGRYAHVAHCRAELFNIAPHVQGRVSNRG